MGIIFYMLSIKFYGRAVKSGQDDEETVTPSIRVPFYHISAEKSLKVPFRHGCFRKPAGGIKRKTCSPVFPLDVNFHLNGIWVQDVVDSVSIVIQNLSHHFRKQLAPSLGPGVL